MLKQVSCSISSENTSGDLHDQLAVLGAQALIQTLSELENGKLQSKPQDNSLATYAAKIGKSEAKLNWQQSAVELDRKVRAFNPWPVAFTQLNENIIRIWKAKPLPQKTDVKPGTIIQVDKTGIDAATSDGILKILELQLAGGKRLSVADFLNARVRRDFFILGKIFV
jgi:methionyl-tRNA formyltransferase